MRKSQQVCRVRFRCAIRFCYRRDYKNIVLGRPLHVVREEDRAAVAIVIEYQPADVLKPSRLHSPLAQVTSRKVPVPVLRKRRVCPTQVTENVGKIHRCVNLRFFFLFVAETPMPYSSTSSPAERLHGEGAIAVVVIKAKRGAAAFVPGQSVPLSGECHSHPSRSLVEEGEPDPRFRKKLSRQRASAVVLE